MMIKQKWITFRRAGVTEWRTRNDLVRSRCCAGYREILEYLCRLECLRPQTMGNWCIDHGTASQMHQLSTE